MKWNLKEIINRKWNIDNKTLRVRAVKGFAIFLTAILLFTFFSRALDGMTIPKVKTKRGEKKIIESSITTNGRVKERKEQAISVVSGIGVSSVQVSEGQEVKVGDLLFSLNKEELEEKIEELENEIKKIDLGVETRTNNASLSDQDKALNAKRGEEDYNKAVERGNTEVSKAYNDLVEAKNNLDQIISSGNSGEADSIEEGLKNTVSEKEEALKEAVDAKEQLESEVTHKIEEEEQEKKIELGRDLTLPEQQEISQKVSSEYRSKLSDADQKISQEEEGQRSAKTLLAEYQNKKQAEEGSAKEKELREVYKTKLDAYNQAVNTQDDGMTTARRSIEDAKKPKEEDSANEEAKIDKEEKEKRLEKLKEIKEAEGEVLSPVDGLVTKIGITTGNPTQEGMNMLLADTTEGTKFVADITKEDEKKIERKDKVILKTEGEEQKTQEGTIDMIQEKSGEPDVFEVTVLLPPQTLEIGKLASMTIEKNSQPYELCVPIEAVSQEQNQAYVLVVKENETILGKEFYAERIDVTILKKNNKYAAIGDGAITKDQKIIISKDKNIQTGDRIRLEEE